MIKTECISINGKAFVRTYSDANVYIDRDGVEYAEAIDLAYLGREYTETTKQLPDMPAEQALDIILGGDGV